MNTATPKYTGGEPPFGYQLDADGQLVADDEEQDAIDLVLELRGYGWSLRKVADHVSDFHSTRTGGNFNHTSIRRIERKYA